MKEKRGQVTIFIVIGILIVAAIVLVSLYTQGIILPLGQEESKAILGSQVEPLRSFASECIERTSVDALNFIGEHAGYENFVGEGLNSIDFAGEKVVVVVRTENGFANRLPSKDGFERAFAGYINNGGGNQLDSCINNFASFETQGFSISQRSREITADLSEETVNVKVDWTIDLKRGRARIPVEVPNVIILMNAEKALRVANDIVNSEASGIEFEGLEHDKYITEHPFTLRSIDIASQNYPTANQKVFMITTIPKSPGEEEFRFYFAVDRSIPL